MKLNIVLDSFHVFDAIKPHTYSITANSPLMWQLCLASLVPSHLVHLTSMLAIVSGHLWNP